MKEELDKRQQLQERQYDFPYHHLIQLGENFAQAKVLFWGYEYASYLEFILQYLKNKHINSLADVGCGDGKFLFEARRILKCKMIGIDYSKKSLQFASAFAPTIKFIQADLLSDQLPQERFECITLIEVVEHIREGDLENFIENVSQLLTPGGLLIITTPSDNIPVNKKHYQHFNKERLQSFLPKELTVEDTHYINTRSKYVDILQHIFSNRFFILNSQPLLSALYLWYKRHFLISTPNKCKRIVMVCRRKQN